MLGSILACQIPGAQLSWRTIHHVFLRSSMSRNASRGVLGIHAVYPQIMQAYQAQPDSYVPASARDTGWMDACFFWAVLWVVATVTLYYTVREAIVNGMRLAWRRQAEASAPPAAKPASRG